MQNDIVEQLQQTVRDAAKSETRMQIVGGGSKRFYGRHPQGAPLAVAAHQGIVRYRPTELVITARAGTPLRQVEATLGESNQELGFEPPHFGEEATLGGTVACGLSGPRRPYAGAARDFLLGAKVLTGKGDVVSFGGEVMKNVAGYDVSRLMVGALGTLGVLLEVSIKVLPKPAEETTVALELDVRDAIATMNRWAGQPLPVSATCYDGVHLYARLSGAAGAVASARKRLGGAAVADGARIWRDLREQRHGFFQGEMPLWRLSVAPATPMLDLPGTWFIDWGGAQRWLKSDAPADPIRSALADVDGHATLFRGGDRTGDVFQPLPPKLMALHTHIKRSFDPDGVLNVGRLYPDW